MKLYALKIRKSDLELLTILNGGVTPKIEKKTTYLVFDVTNTVPNRIVTQNEFNRMDHDIKETSPLLFALTKKSKYSN